MQQCFTLLVTIALAFSTGRLETKAKPTIVTWLIDGTNLQCCSASAGGSRGRKDRQEVINEVEQIPSLSSAELLPNHNSDCKCNKIPITNVVLVFDGNDNEAFQKRIWSPWFQVVVTDGEGKRKDRADDYIIEHALPELQARFNDDDQTPEQRHVVHLVSADKELRKRALATRKMNGGSVVYPPKFWKQYLPNLQQKDRTSAAI
jgi:hypothetical protein